MKKNRNKIANVPNLRFWEFEEEWAQTQFDKICSISTGNKNTQDKEENGIYPFYVRSENIEKINSYSFDGEAILTAGDGVGVGKIFHYVNGKVGVHQRVYILSNFKCLGMFAHYYFSSRFHNRVAKMSAKNSVDSVRREMIAQMPISLPIGKEQEKIAHLLQLIDERISTQSQIIEELKSLKKTLRNNLYKQISKFGKVEQIASLLNYEQPTNYIVENTNYSADCSLIPVLTANKAFILGYMNEDFGIYDKGECIIFDDFTMDLKYVDFLFKVKSSAIKILTAKQGVNLRFIYEYLSFLKLTSTDHKRHYISEIEPICIAVPKIDIQNNTANILSLLDEKIDLETKQYDLLVKQKKYLLANMFI